MGRQEAVIVFQAIAWLIEQLVINPVRWLFRLVFGDRRLKP